MTQRATLLFRFPSPTAQAVARALAPETGGDVPKTSSRLALEGDAIRLDVEAEDLSSLRAAVNSYLRWVDAAARAAALGQR